MNMEHADNTKTNIESYLIFLTVLLFPVLVLPSFANAFVTPKLALVTLVLGVVLVIKSVRGIARNSVTFAASPFDLPVLILGAAYIASSILQTPNKMEAYFLPGTATVVVGAILLFFVVNQMPKKAKDLLKYFLVASGTLVSIAVLFASAGILGSIKSLPPFVQATTFTPLGGPLPTLMFLAGLAPIAVFLVIEEKQIAQKVFFSVSVVLIVLAATICLFNSLPGKDTSTRLPGFNTSWVVAVEALKQSPLLGVGPGDYLSAFNRFRPISYNSTDLWPTRFTSAQSFALTAITETGLAGAAAMVIIVYFLFKTAKERAKLTKGLFSAEGSVLLSLLILGGSLLVFPSTPTLLFTFFILLALVSRSTNVNLGMFSAQAQNAPFAARFPVMIITLPVIILVAIYSLQATRFLEADMAYKSALDYLVKNDGRGAYDTLQKAINSNPYVDRYRITYAQVNLALANSIAQNQNISESDRNTIAQLVQQAIREGKAAVALNPGRAGNWEVLGSIYRAVMPLAQGADAFAVQTYSRAVVLDPLNPNARIALGGVYYAAKAYEDAIDVFKLAVAVKPDHANAHYNLAVAYRENGNIDRAISEISIVLSIVDRNSEDYKVASQILEDLQNKKGNSLPEGENLTAPPSGEQSLTPPLSLPEEAAPPQPEEASPLESGDSPSPTALP